MDTEKLHDFSMRDNWEVKVTRMGNIKEIQYLSKRNTKQIIQRLDKDTYMNLATGEICEVNHMENRADDKRSIQKTMYAGRAIINTNVTDVRKGKFVTGTYVENMTDFRKLYKDIEYFVKKMRKKYGHFEHITAREPQERGAWHFHMIMIFDRIAPYIPNHEIQDIWGHGMTFTRKLDSVDDVGAYLTAYLTDVPVLSDADILPGDVIKVNDDGKKFKKGARLKFYPPGMRVFTWSKGIKKPEVEYTDYATAKKEVSSDKLTFSSSLRLKDEKYQTVIHKEYYNKIRK